MTNENNRSILAFTLALAGFLIVCAVNLLPYTGLLPQMHAFAAFGITIFGILLAAFGGVKGKSLNEKNLGSKPLNTAAYILEYSLIVVILLGLALSFIVK